MCWRFLVCCRLVRGECGFRVLGWGDDHRNVEGKRGAEEFWDKFKPQDFLSFSLLFYMGRAMVVALYPRRVFVCCSAG